MNLGKRGEGERHSQAYSTRPVDWLCRVTDLPFGEQLLESELEELARGVWTEKIMKTPSTILRAEAAARWEPGQQAPAWPSAWGRAEASEMGSLNTTPTDLFI